MRCLLMAREKRREGAADVHGKELCRLSCLAGILLEDVSPCPGPSGCLS